MKSMTRMMLIAAASGMLLSTVAVAQDVGSGGDDAAIQQILNEIKALRNEVKALRNDVRKLQNDVTKIQSASRNPTATPPPRRPPVDTTVYDINVGDSPIRGPKDAKVTITEFVCLQCPFCIREWPKLEQIMKEYPNDVRVVFKHFPLSFHKKAKPAHASCALAQREKGTEGFWQMHDKIVANPKKLEVSDLRGYAEELGLNLAEFDRVMASTEEIDKLLAADLTEARKCKVRGTPTVFINGLKLKPRNLPDYKQRIDAILAGKDQPAAKRAAASGGDEPRGIIKLRPGGEAKVEAMPKNAAGRNVDEK